jgi:hypothetical protein
MVSGTGVDRGGGRRVCTAMNSCGCGCGCWREATTTAGGDGGGAGGMVDAGSAWWKSISSCDVTVTSGSVISVTSVRGSRRKNLAQ